MQTFQSLLGHLAGLPQLVTMHCIQTLKTEMQAGLKDALALPTVIHEALCTKSQNMQHVCRIVSNNLHDDAMQSPG